MEKEYHMDICRYICHADSFLSMEYSHTQDYLRYRGSLSWVGVLGQYFFSYRQLITDARGIRVSHDGGMGVFGTGIRCW
jgi:hypothetical protein